MINSKNLWGALVGLAFIALGSAGAANGKVGPSIGLVVVGLMFAGWHIYHLVQSRRTSGGGASGQPR